MSNLNTAVKKTQTLKTLDRIKGTEGNKDYFILHRQGVLAVAIKVNYGEWYPGLFARVRIVRNDKKIDLLNLHAHFHKHGLMDKGRKRMGLKKVQGVHFKADEKRVSFIIASANQLSSYGDPTNPEGYDSMCSNMASDMTKIGNRVYESLAFAFDLKERQRKLINNAMADFAGICEPAKPKGYAAYLKAQAKPQAKAKATVTAITKKANAKK